MLNCIDLEIHRIREQLWWARTMEYTNVEAQIRDYLNVLEKQAQNNAGSDI